MYYCNFTLFILSKFYFPGLEIDLLFRSTYKGVGVYYDASLPRDVSTDFSIPY